ncbi:MAG: phosphoglycerate kinase [Malacoplasma sp.]|nr:phosphoglycerate kinase [Malacoplasma sp.]
MEYNKKIITDLNNLEGKKVILRCDFNVPLDKQTLEITDYTRIDAALKTINYLIDKKAKVIILSHLSRIKSIDDIKSGKKSLIPVFNALKKKLPNVKIVFEKNNTDPLLFQKINNMENGSIMILENTRYYDENE